MPFSDDNTATVQAFIELLDGMLDDPLDRRRPPVVTFWCGAGFSKAWDPSSPTDGDLFAIDLDDIHDFPNLQHVLHVIGWADYRRLNFEQFKNLRYVLDMQVRYPDIRNRYFDIQNLKLSISELRTLIMRRFQAACDVQNVDDDLRFTTERDSMDQQNITALFALLEQRARHAGLDANCPLYHFLTTNYDFTIESILERVHAHSAPVFGRLYRGVTPSRICGSTIWEHLPRTVDRTVIKINGGFEILPTLEGFEFEYRARSDRAIREAPPLLILPSQVQDYDEPYFHQVFPKAVRLLRETDVLVIVGYSMPPEDALIRFILRQLAESPSDARGKHVFVIDTKNHDIIKSRLEEVFFYLPSVGWPREHYFSGRFEEFCRRAVTQ
ncbi:SIR2 family protein [Larsenimonas salina]|uniref:SIR2 family protein n=1 Tax=Larsenimonas salina TaxID=1295565 RepID=UPI002073BC8C|nr:SIR2 family protein [Larsenimonas salina]MCM5704408.1 SIR2 family protein [Larsenimonas salina]